MKHMLLTVVVLLTSLSFAQNPVEKAKANLAEKHQKMLVEKAEKLLERQKDLEAELASVKAKLEKLSNGEDVKVDEPASGTGAWISSGTLTCCVTAATTTGQ
jgi:hypothetical protein